MCPCADAISQVRRIRETLALSHAIQKLLPFLWSANDYQKA